MYWGIDNKKIYIYYYDLDLKNEKIKAEELSYLGF